jgi:hypothetical protein
MITRDFCEYCSKQPTNVAPEISISYFKNLKTSTDEVIPLIRLWAQRFAKEHLTDMFAWDSIGDSEDGWIIFLTAASDHIFVVELSEGQEVLHLVERGTTELTLG